jgi:hypothetical protein
MCETPSSHALRLAATTTGGTAIDVLAIRQFLDIGTGLPTVDNTHEVAQRIAPESRIVYVDNDRRFRRAGPQDMTRHKARGNGRRKTNTPGPRQPQRILGVR